MTTLASIQQIVSVERHPNADSLDIAQVKEYKAIVKRDQWKVGDLCVFIEPDAQLPDGPSWTAFYRAKSSRVRAIKLRGVFSFGIVESLDILKQHGQLTQRGGIIWFEPGVSNTDAPSPPPIAP